MKRIIMYAVALAMAGSLSSCIFTTREHRHHHHDHGGYHG